MKRILISLFIGIACSCVVYGQKSSYYHELQPAKVVSDTSVGDYRRVMYVTTPVYYKGQTYNWSLYTGGHYFLFGSISTVVLDSKGRQKYYIYNNAIDNWKSSPTFFLPNRAGMPTIIAVSEGMELNDNTRLFLLESDGSFFEVGSMQVYIPNEYGEGDDAVRVMRPVRHPGTTARLTFDCDTVAVSYGMDKKAAREVWFDIKGDSIVGSKANEDLPAVRERRFYERFSVMKEEMAILVDVNGDGHIDAVTQKAIYDYDNIDNYAVNVYLCRDFRPYETLRIVPERPLILTYYDTQAGTLYFDEYNMETKRHTNKMLPYRFTKDKKLMPSW